MKALQFLFKRAYLYYLGALFSALVAYDFGNEIEPRFLSDRDAQKSVGVDKPAEGAALGFALLACCCVIAGEMAQKKNKKGAERPKL